MDALGYTLLVVGGLFAGAINTLAGGGSLITLPLMLFLGMPAALANGTNRVAILAQNVAATASFRAGGVRVGRLSLWLLGPAALGTVIGAFVAIDIDERLFRRVLGIVMLLFAVWVLFDKKSFARDAGQAPDRRPGAWHLLAFFALGIYGGFLQAGIGVLIIAALVGGMGLDLVRANAVKVSVVLGYTAVALAIFWAHRKVDALAGLALAAGHAAGGVLGARLTVKKGSPFVRAVLIAVVVASSVKLLGIADLVMRGLGR